MWEVIKIDDVNAVCKCQKCKDTMLISICVVIWLHEKAIP